MNKKINKQFIQTNLSNNFPNNINIQQNLHAQKNPEIFTNTFLNNNLNNTPYLPKKPLNTRDSLDIIDKDDNNFRYNTQRINSNNNLKGEF